MSEVITDRIVKNYSGDGLVDRVRHALDQVGLGSGLLIWTDLVSFDQFHARGLEASKELAAELHPVAGQSLLDVGSGFGGPARFLAALYDVSVTGIDLAPEFVEVANYLSQRAGLADKLHFMQGDATELPVKAEQFDLVWTQHVAMNIRDKKKFYTELYRVLKPGGRLAIYDVLQGINSPVLYPTPWAQDAEMSFLMTEPELKDMLAGVGFAAPFSTDRTEAAASYFRESPLQQTLQRGSPRSPSLLSLPSILGPDMSVAVGNFARNVLEARVRILQVIAQKD